MSRMPGAHYRKIQRNSVFIYDNIVNIDGVTEYLFGKEVLTHDHINDIESMPMGRRRVKGFLHIVMTECGDCYHIFLDALRAKNLGSIAEQIDKETDPEPTAVRVEPPVTRSQSKVKVEKGKMIPDHFATWTRQFDFLVAEFKGNLEDLMRKFISNHIINMDDKEMVRREVRDNYKDGGATKLVEILCERGEWVLPRIIETLKPHYGKVAARLEQQLLAESNTGRYSFPIQETGS